MEKNEIVIQEFNQSQDVKYDGSPCSALSVVPLSRTHQGDVRSNQQATSGLVFS